MRGSPLNGIFVPARDGPGDPAEEGGLSARRRRRRRRRRRQLTFWPRSYNPRTFIMFQVLNKDLGRCGTDMCTEFRSGSHPGSQIGWRGHI